MPESQRRHLQIVSEDFVIAARNIRARTEEIIDLWCRRVRKEIAAAREQDPVTLRDGLADFLEALAAYIPSVPGTQSGERFASEVIHNCKLHGQQRALTTGYSLDHVIIEYRILRRVILEVLDEPVSPHISGVITKILEAIDYGISEAATAFAQIKSFDKGELYEEARKKVAQLKAEKDFAKLEAEAIRVERDKFGSLVANLKREREIREQFVATLTHDLKNPLSAAQSCAELIIRDANKCIQHPMLAHQIVKNLERTDRMITDLLDANLIRAGERLPLKITEMDLNALISQTIDDLTTVYGKTRFVVRSSEERIEGYWSPGGIRRVLENLVTNALKYGDSTKPIQISSWKEDHQVCLAVHNKGKAISAKDQAAVFTPFLRAQWAQSSGKKGWGLGLTLVRGIMDAHGGSVTVESSPEKGTTFQVTLPMDSRPFQPDYSNFKNKNSI